MKKIVAMFLLAFLLPACLYAQEKLKVTGQVFDEANMSIPGAAVMEKGTTNGTVTDMDGNFTLTVSGKNAVLVVSFIGYKTQEITPPPVN